LLENIRLNIEFEHFINFLIDVYQMYIILRISDWMN